MPIVYLSLISVYFLSFRSDAQFLCFKSPSAVTTKYQKSRQESLYKLSCRWVSVTFSFSPKMGTQTVRLRLVFDRSILSKTQKAEGLKRCWVLLKAQQKTISDLSSYLLRTFSLHDASPYGLLLSMEGFVLPPFESTSIFKDKDIVRVKRKECELGTRMIVVNSIVENPLEVATTTGVKLLGNGGVQESGGYESESQDKDDGDAILGRQQEESLELCVHNAPKVTKMVYNRKASRELQGSGRKRKKPDNGVVSVEDVGTEEKNGNSGIKVDERSKKKRKASTDSKQTLQLQDNGNGGVDALDTVMELKKLPSRSARRKKAKRQWLRELKKAEKQESHQCQPVEQSSLKSFIDGKINGFEESLCKETPKFPEKRSDGTGNRKDSIQELNEDTDADDDIFPVVIRPGHIRFEPLQKAGGDQVVQLNEVSKETFQWNGITSKKKGQRWGKEKATYSKWSDYSISNQDHSEVLSSVDKPKYGSIDFDKLDYYATLPKEEDVIAYRLIELSSTWTPEISSYRVGKIARYDMESNRIMLIPVPEYPIPTKNVDDDKSAIQTETSIYSEDYREDGSLEVNYSSLIEIRLVCHGNRNPEKAVPNGDSEFHAIEDAGTSLKHDDNDNMDTSGKENGELNAWAEIDQTLKLKKAQLLLEDDCSKPKSSQRRSWSYNTLRGSALGPTMALLRAENGLTMKSPQ